MKKGRTLIPRIGPKVLPGTAAHSELDPDGDTGTAPRVLKFGHHGKIPQVQRRPRIESRRLPTDEIEVRLWDDAGALLVTAVLHGGAANALLAAHLMAFANECRAHDAPIPDGGHVLAFASRDGQP